MNQEEIDKINQKNIQRAKKQYEEFLTGFKNGECYLCRKRLDFFNEKEPCLHWLLCPKNIKKKFFKEFFLKFDLFQINSYLMWVSYQENRYTNINNLTLEKDENKLWETTIEYKKLRWSLSCSQTDFSGHKESKNNFPHYHFLMGVNGKPFISFNDFHIRLTKDDIIKLRAHNNPLGNFVHIWYIPGMEEIFSLDPKELIKKMKTAKEESSAPFHVTSMFEMDGGIPSEKITEALLKSKKTGDTFAKSFSEIPGIKYNIFIEPGEGVPKLDKKLSRGKRIR